MASGTLRTAGLALKVEGAAGFQQALNSSSQAINRNNAEMKLLEATYGKGSTAMEYLSQRSQLLAQKLEEQHKRTEALQQARDRYAQSEDADAAKLEKLDLQIIKSKTAEADLARQIKECSAEMDKQAQEADDAARSQEKLEQAGQGAADTQKQLGSAAAEAASDMNAAGKSADAYVKKIEGIGSAMERAGKMGTRFLTLPIMGMGTAAVKYNLDFEDAVYEVATLPGVLSGTAEEQAAQLEEYADRLIEASDRSFTQAKELAAAQYSAISANVAPEDSVYWAERAGKAGIAGRTDADTVVNGASSAYNAWGEKATGGLDHILDVMMVAQNKGKTTVGELAGSIGQITGLAPQVGMAMEETFASVAAMTRSGEQTSSAITGLRGVLTAVIKPSEQAKKKAEELGLQFSVAAMQSKGLTGFLADVEAKTKGDSEAMGQLFGNVNGLNAVMKLAGSASQDYIEILQEMRTASGVLDQAFETRTSSRAMQLSGSMNQLKNRGIELAENLYPAVDMVTGLIGKAAAVAADMDAGTQKTLLGVLGFTAAAGPAITGAGKLLKHFGAIKAAMSSPWGWAALGAAGVGALVYQIMSAESAADRLERTAREMKIEADPASVKQMQEQVQRVISLVEKEHYVSAQLNWSINGDEIQQQLTDSFNTAIEDAHITMSEYSELVKLLQGDIGGEISDARQDPLTSALAGELQNAVDEFNGLLELVYRKGGTATEEEITNLETALERVKALRAELLGAYTEADAAEMSMYEKNAELIKEGFGDQSMLADAIGLAFGKEQIAIAGNAQAREKVSAQREARLQEADTREEKALIDQESDNELAEIDRSDAAAAAARNAELTEIWNGWMGKEANRGTEELLDRFGRYMDMYSALMASSEDKDVMRGMLSPEFMREIGAYTLLDDAGRVDLNQSDQWAWQLKEALSREMDDILKQVEATAENGENPIAAMWETWLSNGFDPSTFDTSQLDGSLAGWMRLLLYQEGGLDAVGSEAMEAIGSGIAVAAPGTVKEADDAAGGVSDALKRIDSPYDAGYRATEELMAGIRAGEPYLLAMARSVAQGVSDELSVVMPGMGLFGGGGSSGRSLGGGGSTNVDSSVNVTIQRANMMGPTNVNALADRIGAISKSRLMGVGVTTE